MALDLDGTLIDERMTIADRVRRKVLEAQRRGVIVTLATGRMFGAALPFARELHIEAPLICYQGGLIQAPDAASSLYRATMDRQLVREVLAWASHGSERGWQMVLYADDALFVAERRYPEEFYRDLLGENLCWVDDLASVLNDHQPVKFLFIVDPCDADRVETVLRRQFDRRLEVVRSHARFVEGNPPGVSKGDALQRLAVHLTVPQGKVMAVGDQDNDVSMIRWAGVGVAMGNASPAATAVANWIAPPFSEHGVTAAIDHFIFQSQGRA